MKKDKDSMVPSTLSTPTIFRCDKQVSLSDINFRDAIEAQLSIELDDKKVAHQLAPFIIEGIFDKKAKLVEANKVNNLIAFAFGNRANDSNNPDELAKPGPMNKDLAACCMRLYRSKRVKMYVQWEIARFLNSEYYPDINDDDVISIEPYRDDEGKLVYLSTDGVVTSILDNYNQGDPDNLGVTAVIGHSDHVKRCVMVCRSHGIDAYAPNGLTLPSWYDDLSAQAWTRRRDLYVLQDTAAQLSMIAQANIAKAYSKG